MRTLRWFHRVILLLVGLSLTVSFVSAEVSAEESPLPPEKKNASEEKSPEGGGQKAKRYRTEFKADGTPAWGSYYDPQNVFCGEYDCYKILGFDFESFGKDPPDTKEITKNYRGLSREWHPDKSKHKNAKELFVKIARAYEILTDTKKREEYDFMRYNQEAYFQTYGSSVLWQYAPKSDVIPIVLVLFLIGNAFTWFAQKSKWQNVADRLVKAAAEDWSPSQGGSPESKQLREEALGILTERTAAETAATTGEEKQATPTAATKKGKSKGGKKITGKEKKKQELESLIPILKEIVNDMEDFGGGFHKPTWRDLLVVSLLRFPYYIVTGTFWRAKYYVRRLRKLELNEEERELLTQSAVGPVVWDLATDEAREEMIGRELWKTDNLVEWKEEQEILNLSAKEQKYIKKMMKKEKGGKKMD